MHTLHTRAASIYSSWAEEQRHLEASGKKIEADSQTLWSSCWCPLLQGQIYNSLTKPRFFSFLSCIMNLPCHPDTGFCCKLLSFSCSMLMPLHFFFYSITLVWEGFKYQQRSCKICIIWTIESNGLYIKHYIRSIFFIQNIKMEYKHIYT